MDDDPWEIPKSLRREGGGEKPPLPPVNSWDEQVKEAKKIGRECRRLNERAKANRRKRAREYARRKKKQQAELKKLGY